jgi:hypothetical protein
MTATFPERRFWTARGEPLKAPSRLRKNGLRDLDSLRSQRFCDSGRVLAVFAGVPQIHFRACEYTATSAHGA